jgi:hypothetical protein
MKKIIVHLFILLLCSLSFSSLAYGEETKTIPKINLVTMDHIGENEILNIDSSAESEVQFQIFYTKKDDGVNWSKVDLINFMDSWTNPTAEYNNYQIDISELNLNTKDYRFSIRVKSANSPGTISNKWGSYDSAYSFVSSSLSPFISSEMYREFTSEIDVPMDKVWTVKFNKEIDDISNFKIQILDSLGNVTNIKSAIDETNKTQIKIYPPVNGYNQGMTYYLLIDTLSFSTPNNLLWEFKIKQKPPINEALIKQLLSKYKSRFNSDIINNPNKYNLQILYTEINRDKSNVPTFTSYKYNVDAKKYFYPASSVKLSATILSLDKINNLKISGLSKYTTMNIGAAGNGQTPRNGESISSYIQRILLYSDNDSFSRLYEFLGQKYYNDTLVSKGYKNSKIIHRLSGNGSYENNKYTNPISFYAGNKKIYTQPLKYSGTSYSNKGLTNLSIGKGELLNGKVNYSPKDFTYKNSMSIEDLQSMVKTVFFNSYMPKDRQFNLTKDDTEFLKKYMKGTGSVEYKYLICGGTSKIPSGVEIYNKIGMAYGELTDNAYILDKNSGREFMLTTTIYVNSDGILNDDVYDYYTKGMPFLKNLGLMFLDYNKSR